MIRFHIPIFILLLFMTFCTSLLTEAKNERLRVLSEKTGEITALLKYVDHTEALKILTNIEII